MGAVLHCIGASAVFHGVWGLDWGWWAATNIRPASNIKFAGKHALQR